MRANRPADAPPPQPHQPQVRRHVDFTAIGTNTRIAFRSKKDTCAGPIIDFVRLEAVAR